MMVLLLLLTELTIYSGLAQLLVYNCGRLLLLLLLL